MAYVAGNSAGRNRARQDGPGSERAGAPERTSLSAHARDAVRERIVDRRYPQGARLVEREVAEELRMSRVPVREALRALVGEGLLELLPHSGVRVRRMERADVEHLYEVWEPLAVQASRLAARRVARSDPAEPSGVTALRTSLDRALLDPLTGEVTENAVVVIAGGVVRAAGPRSRLGTRTPSGVPVLRAHGQWILPGLVDAHIRQPRARGGHHQDPGERTRRAVRTGPARPGLRP
ncbi:GntR family transcriptional regulator [Streptomyces anulatus]|uniref:GntR family transcriptional regulator n=1 Tax=Streptomyces anulatus TaxID=1892 RepID=UPI0038633DA1|nr:GntR family transcriptional regulator [Streptomyces anulatus]